MSIKYIVRMISIVSLFVSIFFSHPTNSVLAASCSGSQCTGKDPVATGCASNITVLSSANLRISYSTSKFAWGKVDLVYSNTCKTKWARVTSYNLKVQPDGATVNWDYVFMKKYGQTAGYYQKKGVGTTIWTSQIYAPNVSWMACGSLGEGYYNFASDYIICTGASTK